MARPTKFCESVAGVLTRAVRAGLPIEQVAGVAGIAPSTVYDWMKRRQDFRQRVTKARGELAGEAWGVLWRAGSDDWRAAAKWLELAHPTEYGPQRGIEP